MLRDEEDLTPLAGGTDLYVGLNAGVERRARYVDLWPLDERMVGVATRVPRGRQVFRKVGPRAAQAISKVVMAAIGDRVAFGSLGPVVMRAHHLEAYLAEGGRDRAEAARALDEDYAPIDDVRSTAEYRRRVAANLIGAWMDERG